MVERLGYSDFFLVTALLGIPTLVLIAWQWSRTRKQADSSDPLTSTERS
jgi:PAT family beta-lactamase induction signal transducer AmpG